MKPAMQTLKEIAPYAKKLVNGDAKPHFGVIYVHPLDLIAHNNLLHAARQSRAPISSTTHSDAITSWIDSGINVIVSPMNLSKDPAYLDAGRLTMLAAIRVARHKKRDIIVLEKQTPVSQRLVGLRAEASPESIRLALETLEKLTSDLGLLAASEVSGPTSSLSQLSDVPDSLTMLIEHPIDQNTSYTRRAIAASIGDFVGDRLMSRFLVRPANPDSEHEPPGTPAAARPIYSSLEDEIARPNATTALY